MTAGTWALFVANWFALGVCWWMAIELRRIRHANADLRGQLHGATYFANALAERGVGLHCDDCGNPLSLDQEIDVIERADGTSYIGHRSHGRRFDEQVRRVE